MTAMKLLFKSTKDFLNEESISFFIEHQNNNIKVGLQNISFYESLHFLTIHKMKYIVIKLYYYYSGIIYIPM